MRTDESTTARGCTIVAHESFNFSARANRLELSPIAISVGRGGWCKIDSTSPMIGTPQISRPIFAVSLSNTAATCVPHSCAAHCHFAVAASTDDINCFRLIDHAAFFFEMARRSGTSWYVREPKFRSVSARSDRQREHLQIERERLMSYVPGVERKTRVPRDMVATLHLCPAGEAGQYLMPLCLFAGIASEVFDEERPRANKTHVAAKDAPEFRQFVEAG